MKLTFKTCWCFGYLSLCTTKHHNRDNLKKKASNLKIHSSRGLGSMAIMVQNMVAGSHGTETVAKTLPQVPSTRQRER